MSKETKEIIEVNGKEMVVKEYADKRLVTFKDIDELHNRPEGTARVRFNRNKKRLVENEDYIVSSIYEAENLFGITAPNGLTLLTETGYLMIVKSFNDDLAWQVQRSLVSTYFKAKEIISNTNFMSEEQVKQLLEQQKISFETQQSVNELKSEVNTLNNTVKRMSSVMNTLVNRNYSQWKTDMYRNLNALAEEINIGSFDILKNIYSMLRTDYGVDLNKLQREYILSQPNITSIPVIDIIDLHSDVKDIFDSILNNYKALTSVSTSDNSSN